MSKDDCRFIDNGDDYKNWILGAGGGGYVANIPESRRPDYFVIHRPTCGQISTIEGGDWPKFVERDYRKVVGEDLDSIVAWGKTNGFDPREFKCCGLCMRGESLDSLLSDVQAEESSGSLPQASDDGDNIFPVEEVQEDLAASPPGGLQFETGAGELDTGKLIQLAELLRGRNEIDRQIAKIINRPALPGHIGEFIASGIFDIELCESAVTKGIDGHFRSGPLAGRSVNVKIYGKQESILDINPKALPDYYLVLTGDKSPASSSKGKERPLVVRRVYLFEAQSLFSILSERGVKIGVATSVAKAYWEDAELFPQNRNQSIELTDEQLKMINAFDGTAVDNPGGEGNAPAPAKSGCTNLIVFITLAFLCFG